MCIIWHFVVELWPTEKRNTVWVLDHICLALSPPQDPPLLCLNMCCSVCSVMWQCCSASLLILWHAFVEMADMHIMFSCAYGSEFAAQDLYQYTLPGQWLPDRHFVALVSTLGKEGNVYLAVEWWRQSTEYVDTKAGRHTAAWYSCTSWKQHTENHRWKTCELKV